MWEDLPSNQKEKYKTLITKFASLSEAFAQKADDDSDTIIAPIVNSKFQETAFSYAFNATVEDIANSSYDASLTTKEGKKYIVGIKTFGVSSGDQKVAQFKASSNKWTADFEKIKEQALSAKDKSEADKINDSLYKRIARQIATLRNARIESSKAQLRGFNDESEVQSVYHFLMPSKKGALPSVTVGETSYREIDIDHIQIQGSTGQTTPQNFNFTDGYHNYRYTSADSQLLMDFHHSISSDNNDSIHIWPEWSVEYVDNAISVFENLSIKKDEDKIIESYSWMITDETGKVEPFSGFNGFYGASKLQKKDNYRENRIDKILQKFKHILTEEESTTIEQLLKIILLPDDSKDHVRIIQARDELMNLVKKLRILHWRMLFQKWFTVQKMKCTFQFQILKIFIGNILISSLTGLDYLMFRGRKINFYYLRNVGALYCDSSLRKMRLKHILIKMLARRFNHMVHKMCWENGYLEKYFN